MPNSSPPTTASLNQRVKTRTETRIALWKVCVAIGTVGLSVPFIGLRKRSKVYTTHTAA